MALVAMLAPACTATRELDAIKTQLSDIQLQVLQLQKQGPSKDQIADLESSLSARVDSILQSEAEVRVGLGELSAKIGQLESKLEETVFRLQQLSQQIASTLQELQAVRSAAEQARASATARAPQPVNPADPQTLYDTAYNDYLQGNYDLSILGFRQYVETYRGTDLADNATYWIGECFYRQEKFQKAIDQFDEVLSQFRGSDRTASALLKKGYAYLQLGQRAQGVVLLQSAVCEHGDTDEAALAGQRLQEMGIDVDC